uniref:Uncharacterized protein n=1 Tax=Heterorhabditis bacteriophora TaxID=37862 RepID=A0A1I7XA29_HETBA
MLRIINVEYFELSDNAYITLTIAWMMMVYKWFLHQVVLSMNNNNCKYLY